MRRRCAPRCGRDLADVEEHIRGNSWLAGLEAGRLSPAALRAFVGVKAASIAQAARLLRAYELLYWSSLPR